MRQWTRREFTLPSIRHPAATRSAKKPFVWFWMAVESLSSSPPRRTSERIEPAEPRRITPGRCHISSLLLLPFGPSQAGLGRAGPQDLRRGKNGLGILRTRRRIIPILSSLCSK